MGFPAELKMRTFGPRSFGDGVVVSTAVSEIFEEAFVLDDDDSRPFPPRAAACRLFDFFDLDALAGMML